MSSGCECRAMFLVCFGNYLGGRAATLVADLIKAFLEETIQHTYAKVFCQVLHARSLAM